jgi:hypothetical protein
MVTALSVHCVSPAVFVHGDEKSTYMRHFPLHFFEAQPFCKLMLVKMKDTTEK